MASIACRQAGSPDHGQAISQKTPAAQREIKKADGLSSGKTKSGSAEDFSCKCTAVRLYRRTL